MSAIVEPECVDYMIEPKELVELWSTSIPINKVYVGAAILKDTNTPSPKALFRKQIPGFFFLNYSPPTPLFASVPWK